MAGTYKKLPPDSGGTGGTTDEILNTSTIAGATATDALNNVSTTIVQVQYKPSVPIEISALDITNRYILLSEAPANPDKTIIYIIGAGAQEYGVDFVYLDDAPAGPRVSWNGKALEATLSVGDKLIIVTQ